MKELIVMVGIPGSGKSTWIKNHMNENDICISRDKIRFSLIKDTDYYFSKEKEVYQKFIQEINETLQSSIYQRIFIDATHITKGSRGKLLSKINCPNTKIIFVVMKTPLEICLQRNSLRTGLAKVPEGAIKEAYKIFHEPTQEEGIVYTIEEE